MCFKASKLKWIKYTCWSEASCELIFVCVVCSLPPLNQAVYLRDGPRASARDARFVCSAHGGARHHGSLLGRYVGWRLVYGCFFLATLDLFCNIWLKDIVKYIGRKRWRDLSTCVFSLWVFSLLTETAAPCPCAQKALWSVCFFSCYRGNATCFETLEQKSLTG